MGLLPHKATGSPPLVSDSLRRCRVRKPEDLAARSVCHRHCLAPWRIAVVGASGNATPCNCAPEVNVGDVSIQPFADIWNGAPLQSWRTALLGGASAICRSCPRH